jgi:hypothetical protein
VAARALSEIYSGSATRYRATTTRPGMFFSEIRDERKFCMRDSAPKMERGDKCGSVKKLVNALGRSENGTYRRRKRAVAFCASWLRFCGMTGWSYGVDSR